MLTPQELKFIAYEELIEVEPSTTINSLSLIHRHYKDIVPLSICKLPLYIALELKKSNLVHIRLPHCYTLSVLSKILENEISNEKEYLEINPNMFSTGKIIINNSYNTDNKEELVVLIDKIKEVRNKKSLLGLSKMEGRALNLNNLTMSEWYEIREILVRPMEERRKILNKD
jgi:GINS complex subunit 2